MDGKGQTKIRQFLTWAQEKAVSRDRGTLANLRRGFSSGTEHRCWPYIARYCNLNSERERTIWQTIAAGVATHEGTSTSGNFGTTLRKLALEGSSGKRDDALKTFDARFRRLLSCSTAEEVCQRLPGIIRTAKSKGDIPINYEKLFYDLWYWNNSRAKLSWAATYWGEKKNGAAQGEKK